MLKLATFFILCFTRLPFASAAIGEHSPELMIKQALDQRLDESLQWQRLIHYRKTWRGWRSEADNPLFFVAKDGRTNPRSELSETLRLGFANTELPVAMPNAPAMTVRCQFPARWKWLLKELNLPLSEFPLERCAKYDEYIARHKPQSVTFVFSGFYVDNPSSSFGHVLLRLNRQAHTDLASTGAELLDHGVGFAADANTGNPVLYAIGGFAGWFPSSFTSLPFYYKVREYSDAESRDLWEYDLNLKPEELERLTDHLWELGSTYFYYYYLRENCAYYLLTLIEAAAPRVQLLDRMPVYFIPIDSVKAVFEEPGLVGRITYRPSTARILRARLATLTPDERQLFYQVRNQPEPATDVKSLKPDSAARILDAVLDDIDYRGFHELVNKSNPALTQKKQTVLIARAQLPVIEDVKVPVTERDRPDLSHGSARFWLGAGQQANGESATTADRHGTDQRGIVDAELRFAIHDIHDPLDGYLPYSSVEFGRFRARFDQPSNRVELQSFSLVDISSLAPIDRVEKKPAWRVNIGMDRVRDRRCDSCLASKALIALGDSIEPVSGFLLYGLGGAEGEMSPGFQKQNWDPSLGFTAGLRCKFFDAWQIAGEGEWRRVFDTETFDRLSGQLLLRWDYRSTKPEPVRYAFEASLEAEPNARDTLLKVIHYF